MTIHFVGFWPDYEAAFFAQANTNWGKGEIQVFNLLQESQRIPGFSLLPRSLRNWRNRAAIVRYLRCHPDDQFIVHEHRLVLETLQGLNGSPAASRISIMMRNPVDPKGKTLPIIQRLQTAGCGVWSFDGADVERYGWQAYRQFIEVLPSVAAVLPVYDFAFVGRNKGREVVLDVLQTRLTEKGFSVCLDIRSDSMQGQKVHVTYVEYLQKSLSARCIIDINQAGQAGLTLRPLEALVYGRKLLTNNPEVMKQAFYHPDNVFVLDEGLTLAGVEDFMARPWVAMGEEIRQGCSVAGLLASLSGETP